MIKTTTDWSDVVARVRGLASRVLGRAALERLAASRDLDGLAADLETTPYAAVVDHGGGAAAAALDRQTRRVAGARIGILATWCGARAAALAPLFEDDDRRNVQSIARVVAAQAPVEQRAAGLLPSPALPSTALEELARQPRVRDVGALLAAWNSPYAAPVIAQGLRAHPDFFALQTALDAIYAARMLATAEQEGEPLVGYVRAQLDAENTRTALAAAAGALEHDPARLFVEGGALLTRERFDGLCRATPPDARTQLARLYAGTLLAPLVPDTATDTDAAMLAAQIRELRRIVRVEPMSLAVVLDFVLRLRAELHDLGRIIWGVALDVPRRRIVAGLITP